MIAATTGLPNELMAQGCTFTPIATVSEGGGQALVTKESVLTWR